jgi:hypothetical protein
VGPDWHRHQWFDGVSAEIVGSITVAGILALIAALGSALT